jgi:hypothetical protein
MTCAQCGQDTTSQLCPPCEMRISANLTRLAVNYVDSEDPSLTPIPSPVGRGAFASKPPANVSWLSWREGADITPILLGWADDWARLWQLTGRIPADIPGLCGWLRNHLARAVAEHPAIVEFADEIYQLTRRSQRYAGRSNPPRAKILCPAIQDQNTECGNLIWIDNTTDPNTPIRCRACGATWTRLQLEHIALHSSGEAWVDVEAAARYAGVSERTIYKRAAAGNIERKGGLYNIATISKAAAG